jgi:pimeloyl-ACP methyl ester carboxylesterase
MTTKRVRTMTAVFLVLALLLGGWLWTPDLDRATLEARYAAAADGSSFATVDGLRLHIRDSAPGDTTRPAIILLHGFGASLHSWQAWAQALSASYRVIRIDLPGAGLTGADPSGDYSDARSLRLLVALLDERGLRRASFIGHSMGGRLAWRFAAEQPARVDKLVLVAPDGFASPGFEYGKPPEVSVLLQAMKFALPRAVVKSGLAPAYGDPQRLTEDDITRYHELVRAPGVRGALLSRMQQMVLQDPTPFLVRVQAPTLLLWGTLDAMIPPANAQDYLKAMPHARLVTLPGLGHLPQEEAPLESLAPVQAFLAEPAGVPAP